LGDSQLLYLGRVGVNYWVVPVIIEKREDQTLYRNAAPSSSSSPSSSSLHNFHSFRKPNILALSLHISDLISEITGMLKSVVL
jgi:hypothetical protein